MVLRGAVDWVWSASGPPGGGRPRAHLPAMHGDWVVAGLLLLLLHGRDEVDHAFALGRDPNLGPAVKVELPHHPRLLLRPGQGLQGGKSVSGLSSHSHLAVLPTPPGRWGGGDSGHNREQPAEFSSGWPPRCWLLVGCGHPKAEGQLCFLLGGGHNSQRMLPGAPRACQTIMGSWAVLLEMTRIIRVL